MKSFDEYNFHQLTIDDCKLLDSIGIDSHGMTCVFIQKEMVFSETIKKYKYGWLPILFLGDTQAPYSSKFPGIPPAKKFSKYTKYILFRCMYTYNPHKNECFLASSILDMNENTLLKLHTKISYFHELIFHMREICRNEIPEDVIKYLLGFI